MKMLRAGIRNTLGALILLARVIREPVRFLTEPILVEMELASILALVWRIMLAAKLFELLPWTRHKGEVSLLVLVFLAAGPLALIVLRFLAASINGFVKAMGCGDDREAAKRAVAIASVFPNPLLCLYLLSPSLSRYFGPVGSTFILYGICGGVGTVMTWISIAKSYRLSPAKSALLAVVPTALTLILVFQIPLFFIDRYSPTVVKGDVDLGVLELRRFPLDSSVDGSGFMKRELLDFTVLDSAELDSAFSRKTVPDAALGGKLAECYRNLAPLLRVSYFDKRNLAPMQPEFPVGVDSVAIYPSHTSRYNRYGKVMILHASHALSMGGYREAETVLREALEFSDALGKSNLGLVGSIVYSIQSRRVSELLAENLLRMEDPVQVRRLADLLYRHRQDPECVLNALRQEYYQLDAVFRSSAEQAYGNWTRISDSTGFYFPGYTWRKLLDPGDTHAILQYLWAKTIVAAAHPKREMESVPPEFAEMARLARPWRVMVYKNTIGRVLSSVAVPIYQAYGRATLENRRHMEATYAAFMLRADYLENGKTGDLTVIPGELRFRDSFSLRNDTLISADSLGSKEIVTIAIR